MIIVKLWGGLGNQMFQYAAARRLAVLNQAQLKLDLSWFSNIPTGDTPRQYELHAFKSVQDAALPGEVKALRGVDIRRWPKLAKRLVKSAGLFSKQTCVREKHYHFDPEVLHLQGDIYLDGYWQSEKYFADVAGIIRADFTVRSVPDALNEEITAIIQGCEAVSLHVRRGDYVSSKSASQHHVTSTLNYYETAISEITSRLRNPHFFVFSDDPGWVKKNLRSEAPITYLDHNGPKKAYEDLRLMSLCRHHVIANSSFSWWGAWLSAYPEKIVIAPQAWFNQGDIDTRDLIPEGWLRL